MSRASRKGSEGSAGKIAVAPIIGSVTANTPGMGGLPSATVNFTPSVYTGKRDEENVENLITYVATSTPGGITGSSQSSPVIVQNLSPGTSYTFKVKATNVLGSSPESASSNAITAPSAPPVFIFVPPPPPVFTPPPPVFTPPVFTPPPPVFTPPVFTPPRFTPPPVFTPPRFTIPPVFTPPRFTIPPTFTPPPPYFVPPPPMFTPPMFTPPPPYFPPPRFPPPPPRFPPPPPRFPPPPPRFRR